MNEAEEEMSKWLAHPNEFGEPPIELKEIHREETEWPLFDKKVSLSFHRYKMKNGFSSIGMTGPITWSFLNNDLSAFTMEEIKMLYAGWYISFLSVNSPNYSKEKSNSESKSLETELKKKYEGFICILDYLRIGELVFYAYRIEADGKQMVMASNIETHMRFDENSNFMQLPPLYYFIGYLFFNDRLL